MKMGKNDVKRRHYRSTWVETNLGGINSKEPDLYLYVEEEEETLVDNITLGIILC